MASTHDNPLQVAITVKALDDSNFGVLLDADNASVTALKAAIEVALGGSLPPARQRLIFRGKILADGSPLAAYGVTSGVTVHLVARPADATISSPDYTGLLTSGIRSPALPSVLASEFTSSAGSNPPALGDRMTGSTAEAAPDAFGDLRPRGTTFVTRTQHDWASISSGTRAIATINQSLVALTSLAAAAGLHSLDSVPERSDTPPERLDSLLDTTPADRDATTSVADNGAIRSFQAGQWVDVLDTVDQWLEAVVMRVRKDHVYVHYSGWPNRWDEWLHAGSERLRPFRTRSCHSTLGYALCPQPVNILSRDYAPPLPLSTGLSLPSGGSVCTATNQSLLDQPHHRIIPHRDASTGVFSKIEVTLKSDDLRALLPALVATSNSITALLASVQELTERQIVQHATPSGPSVQTQFSGRHRGVSDTSSVPSLSDIAYPPSPQLLRTASSDSKDDPVVNNVDAQVADTAGVLAPMLDRFGRILADFAPLLQRMAAKPEFTSQSTTAVHVSGDSSETEASLSKEEASILPLGSHTHIAEASRSGYLALIKPPLSSPWPEDADHRLSQAPGYGNTLAGDASVSLLTLPTNRHARAHQQQRPGTNPFAGTSLLRSTLLRSSLFGSSSVPSSPEASPPSTSTPFPPPPE
jgi:hypothetical protein